MKKFWAGVALGVLGVFAGIGVYHVVATYVATHQAASAPRGTSPIRAEMPNSNGTLCALPVTAVREWPTPEVYAYGRAHAGTDYAEPAAAQANTLDVVAQTSTFSERVAAIEEAINPLAGVDFSGFDVTEATGMLHDVPLPTRRPVLNQSGTWEVVDTRQVRMTNAYRKAAKAAAQGTGMLAIPAFASKVTWRKGRQTVSAPAVLMHNLTDYNPAKPPEFAVSYRDPQSRKWVVLTSR